MLSPSRIAVLAFVLLVTFANALWAGTIETMPGPHSQRPEPIFSNDARLPENAASLSALRDLSRNLTTAEEARAIRPLSPRQLDPAVGPNLAHRSHLGAVNLAIFAAANRNRHVVDFHPGAPPSCRRDLPEPASIVLLGASLAALGFRRRLPAWLAQRQKAAN